MGIIAIGLHTSSAHWHFQLCHHCHITKINILPSMISSDMKGPAKITDGCTEEVHNSFSPVVVGTPDKR
ncbi:hypothetical protein DPEC_G00244010 [Dallia pectoralis]|uniref:Uncharacterized protein n=1 Tax=Dallia pectoralis TaxID=75939 RepID=A0ACC2FVF9_DALPE|nr:hypothetical protein DPEC_G00244010 [Dallia pectoralis]